MFKIFYLEGLFLSKAKKIISMLLAVVMILTAAPLSLLASAAIIEGTKYQEASFSGDSSKFTVDTSATTEVIRVAHAESMFTLGNTIVKATPSGIPESSGSYNYVAYAGETPVQPKLIFKITGAQPDETPTKIASVGSVGFGDCTATHNGDVHTYEWPINGTAPAHTDLVFTITYKVSGSTYTAYAFSHVENILIMNGWMNNKINQNGTVATSRHSAIIQLQSHNMYASMCQDSIQSNRTVGFINYATTEATSGQALLGCGSEDDLDGSINAYGASVGVGLEGTKIGSMIKWNKDKSDTQFNMCTANDSNRGESMIFFDTRTDTIENINLRVTLQNAEQANFARMRMETFGIYHGHRAFGGEEANSSLTGDATASVISVKTHAGTGSTDITGYGYSMTTFKGTGPSTSTTATYNSTTGEYQYSLIPGVYSIGDGDRENRVAGGINLDFIVYDTTDLYNVYTGIMAGTGSYTCSKASGSITFNKGANPQAAMFVSNPTAWNEFVAAYKVAGSLLREPDIAATWTMSNNAYVDNSSNKSTNAQNEINNAVRTLIEKYNALPTYYSKVDAIVNHVYKDASGSEIIIGQQVYNDKDAGTTMVGRPAEIPGYVVNDSTPQQKLLSGANESETVTFFYSPAKVQLVLVTNNDAGDVLNQEVDAGSTIDFETLNRGTKADFDFSHWTDKDGNVISGDFTMPSENYTLTGHWLPSQIKISCIPVIDGVEHSELIENYTAIRPNADGSATPMARPADLVRDGYIFVEFYADKELTTLMTWPKNFYLHDALEFTFYARMVDVYGKIIYESNGGSDCTDSTFVPGETVNPPTPTKKGYIFDGWYKDKELTQAVDWSVSMPNNTGFVAYAKWKADDFTISYDVGKTSTKYDTKSVLSITGPADTVIPKDQYPEVPLKFGYIFDGWMLNGSRFDFEEGVTTYPTEDITLEAIWRSTEYSAFADITAYEKLSGDYVETDSVCAGDVVTFRMSTQTNFYTGSSVFVFMYDANFFELVEEGTAAFAVNENSEYISGIDAKIKGVTNDDVLPWPANIDRTPKKEDGTYANYKAMMIAIDPTISAGNTNCEPMSDGEWIVEFKLKVKDNATGSGTVFMDNAWTRNQENIMGTMFYGWAETGEEDVSNTQNNVVTPFLKDATATITVDEEIPADITITVNANGGSWADGAEKTYTGRTETEIVGYVSPTREGYTITVDETTGKTVWYKVNDDGSFDESVVWAEGYYGKEDQQNYKFAAQWTPNNYDINFYVDGELKRVETVAYESSLADITYIPAAPQGYVFGGWTDAEGNEVDLATTTCPLGGMNVYATWDPATDTPYQIVAHYKANGKELTTAGGFTGTTGYEVQIVESVPATQAPNTIYITLDMLPRVQAGNFIFDPDENTLPIVGTIAADGSLVLDVNYVGKQMTFTFNANGGAWADGSTTYEEKGAFQSVSTGPATNPTRAGYEFAGWANYTPGTTTFNADRTINANWTAKTYPVTFNSVNSTVSGAWADGSTTQSAEYKFGATINAPSDPSVDGYRFLGWATEEDATEAGILGTMDSENGKIFYAVYAPNEYFVNYEISWGGNFETVSDGPFYIGNTVTLRTPEDKTGYTFDGWTIDGNAVGTTVTIATSDINVTGRYTAVNVPVYFNANGGFFDGDATATEKTVEVAYETVINKPSFIPARAGYEFLGWAATTDAGSALTSLGTVDSITEEIRFYAVWKATYAAYTVNIYMQDTTGAYPATPDQVIDTNTGLVGTEVSYVPTDKTGFVLDAANSVLSGTVVGDGSLVLTVKYTRSKYEVKWLDYDGSTIRTDNVYFGAAISAPEAKREGYEFAGWTPSVATAMPANNLEYTATYDVNYYNATFNANGGQFADTSATKAVSTAFGTGVQAPTDATKEGHTLLGWAYAGTTDIVISVDSTTTVNMVVDGLAFDAIWQVNKYNLVYRTYNGVHETFEVAYGTAAADMPAPANAPTRTGYYFNGWSALPATMPASQVNITSAWELETYTLKFNTDGGSEIPDAPVTYNQKYTVPANPTKTGYSFAGWDNTIPTTIGDLGDNGAVVTYTAQWTINQYTITFDTVGGTEIPAITQDYNTAVTAPADPTKTGYTFTGWDKGIPATMPANDVTITASWAINKNNITWTIDGETFKVDENVEYGAAITAPVPTKTGYVFSGWAEQIPATMPDGPLTFTGSWAPATDTKYTVNIHTMDAEGNYETVSSVLEGATESTVYAQYTVAEGFELGANSVTEGEVLANGSLVLDVYLNRKTFTITFENTGDSNTAAISGLYGAAVTAPADPTKTGYTFGGWDKEIPGTIPAENVTITASWNINTYTVKFLDANDSVFESFTLDYNEEIAAPANEPAKDHYTFAGWSLTKITETLNPDDLANVALIDFENAAPTVPVDGLTIYPVFVRVPVALKLATTSTAYIIEEEDDGTTVIGYIGGLETRLDEETLRDSYIAVEGDGRIEVELTKFDICGTGTEVKVIDNVTDEVVGVYYLVIYGDVNGDADIDATDVAMVEDEAIGATGWSVDVTAFGETNSTYDRSKVLAADFNKDGKISSTLDASPLTDVTLFLAEIDQQTGDIIRY